MIERFDDRPVLVTGGTSGIGLATALAFARHGAPCVLTYRFGSADEDEVRSKFVAIDAPEPMIVQADAASEEDTRALLEAVRERHDHLEVLVSNVSAALVVNDIEDYDRRGLLQSIDSTAWPLVGYTRGVREVFGRYPRYVVGMSSTGPDCFSAGYDFVAASKSVLETLCRYMSYRLFDEDVRINVIRSRSVVTPSFEATFGKDFIEFARHFTTPTHFLSADDVGEAALALCSGWMDGLRGQVITVDKGTTFFDDLMRLYEERDRLGFQLS